MHKTSNIPNTFLNDESNIQLIDHTIQKIENNLYQANDVSEAYKSFTSMLADEMDKQLPKKSITSLVTRPKSKYKPYWCEELQEAWDIVCLKERTWLRSRGSQSEKRGLRDSFNQERKNFDKLNRRAKRKYQISEQERLKELYSDNDTHNFGNISVE